MQRVPTFSEAITDRLRIADPLGIEQEDLRDIPIRVGSAGVPFVFVGCTTGESVDRAMVIRPETRRRQRPARRTYCAGRPLPSVERDQDHHLPSRPNGTPKDVNIRLTYDGDALRKV